MEKKSKIDIGFFSEMQISFSDCGSIKSFIVDNVDYDKDKVVKYLEGFTRIASCPRAAIDCVSGQQISRSFFVFEDDKYRWSDFLIYHIKKYNIRLPQDFIDHIMEKTRTT